jgi:hypothetical protein
VSSAGLFYGACECYESSSDGARSDNTRNVELKQDDTIQGRLERTGFTFFITDIELAMTLVRIAADSENDPEKKARNRQNARHAYDTILRLSTSAALSDEERAEVNGKLRQLKSSLEGIGERF